jgi:transcriptional regulator with XRE-family HTH domain
MHISDYRTIIGEKIHRERLSHGWTQEELAEKIDMNPSFLGQVERGLKAASFDTLERLSRIFGMEVVDLLKKDDKAPRSEPQAMERKIVSLLKGYTLEEQKAVYLAMKYILRQNRKLTK